MVLDLMRGLAKSNAGSTGLVLVQAEAHESERGLFHGGGRARIPWQIGVEREGEMCAHGEATKSAGRPERGALKLSTYIH